MSGGLAAVFAHPDDDTFSVGGTVALHAPERGFRLAVLLVTSGEAGRIADDRLATPETLGSVREAEERASWGAVGAVPSPLEFLRYPDGGVADLPRGELEERVADFLVEAGPDVVVTFGPEGITGHADHVAVGEATTAAFHRVRASSGAGPGRGSPPALRRLLHTALPRSVLDRLGERLRQRGLEPPDPTQPFQPRGVPDDAIAVSVDCSSVWGRKLEALRRHRTQAEELEELPRDLWPEILSWEHFVQAWPERSPGSPVLADVFA